MEVKATVQLKAGHMFEFLMRHTYCTFSGLIGVILSVCALAGFFYMLTREDASTSYLIALLGIGLLFTVVQPIMLYNRARKQVKKSEAINKPLEYTIEPKGISVSKEDNRSFCAWDDIIKITSSKRIIMLYTSRVNAFIIPRESIEEYDVFKTLVKENSKAEFIKL